MFKEMGKSNQKQNKKTPVLCGILNKITMLCIFEMVCSLKVCLHDLTTKLHRCTLKRLLFYILSG